MTTELLLSVVTLHMPTKRSESFARLTESMRNFDKTLYEHVVVEDHECLGLLHANRLLSRQGNKIRGKWTYVIDDDDYFVCSDFPTQLKQHDCDSSTSMWLVRANVHRHGILPKRSCADEIRRGCISTLNLLTRTNVWQKHAHAIAVARCGDYAFFNSVRNDKSNYIGFWNLLVSESPRPGGGK